jgi:TATA-box binding protein (TBP) (component of TFIID and TFIIIB)
MTLNLDDEWDNFLAGECMETDNKTINVDIDKLRENCKDLYISTKTKITYLENEVDLSKVFWKLPVLDYIERKEGIIKKQMKITCNTKEEYNDFEIIKDKQKNIDIYTISNIDNPTGHTKFKYICKVNMGISKKDILSYKSKKRGAFYNCFVCILRVKHEDIFKEVNVKIFNTGKLSFPGMLSDEIMKKSLNLLIKIFGEVGFKTNYIPDKVETVLINSNFNCGFYIDRDNLYTLLKNKYNLNVSYDPCSYPGIQCKYTIKECKLSFMIFRTGSVLIVGKCTEKILYEVYETIKNILIEEHGTIASKTMIEEKKKGKEEKKVKKKIIYMSN